MSPRKPSKKSLVTEVERPEPAPEYDARQAVRDKELRSMRRRSALTALEGLGLPCRDYGDGRIEFRVAENGPSAIVARFDLDDLSDLMPSILEATWNAALEAGRVAEREAQADAILAAVPALKGRMKEIAREAVDEARRDEGREW